ncbi:MAG: SIS domain-containing protein [Candidatus Omnitrophica bacterium]|nr:SIS domain-containing protein [Candidatus Omnitrophota bacterium]
MIETAREIFNDSIQSKQRFISGEKNLQAVVSAANIITESIKKGGKVLVFGNGGSAADSQHLAAELVVRFEKERKAIPAVALTTDTSILTAVSNDYDFNRAFSRQVEALASDEDVVVAISTSGNSLNVLEGVKTSKSKELPVIVLAGKDGGKLAPLGDIAIIASSDNTARIQEIHVTVIHIICKLVEDAFA